MTQPHKPKLRGISHGIAAFCALAAGTWLVQRTQTERAHSAVLLYVVTLVAMFGVSAIYHLPNWQPEIRKWWKRLDHAVIFVLIAGTATPFCQLTLPPGDGQRLLITMWIGAGFGVAQSVFWVKAPKLLSAIFYIVVGCLAIPYIPQFLAGLGTQGLTLILIGGGIYALGAAVYAFQKPDPFPHVFGYHEIFHLLVIGASIFHFAAVYGVVKGSQGASNPSTAVLSMN